MRTHLDLFSGIGGFALAAQWNNIQTIAFSEIEPYASAVLRKHWPNVPNLGDIRTITAFKQPVWLLTGGFPCQPFSVAGKRRGSADDRHLWPEMRRVIGLVRPTWVLGENVPGIIRMELDTVLADLEGLGYACWPVCVPACAVGAPHRRDRVWIVAHSALELHNWGRNSGEGRRVEHSNRCCPKCGKPVECVALFDDGHQSYKCKHGHITEDVADPGSRGCEGQGQSFNAVYPTSSEHGEATEPVDGSRPAQWLPEPNVGRVAHGIPNRAHRLRGLGNAIVPQVAAQLIHFMIQAEDAP